MITFSKPKLSDRLRPGVDAAPWVIAEIEKLEQQLASRAAEIAELRETLCSVSTSLPAWQQKKAMDAIAATDPKK